MLRSDEPEVKKRKDYSSKLPPTERDTFEDQISLEGSPPPEDVAATSIKVRMY